jgi:hypothetical protein
MSLIERLAQPHIDIQNKRNEAYNKVLQQCHNHMDMLSRHRKVDCKFTIPKMLFEGGYPPIDYNECFNYLQKELAKSDIDVERLSLNQIFISWEYALTKKMGTPIY